MNPSTTLAQESPEKSDKFQTNIPANELFPKTENFLSAQKSEKNQSDLPTKNLPESEKNLESHSQETKNKEQIEKNYEAFKNEDEEEKNVSSRMLNPDMGFCRNIEEYEKFTKLKRSNDLSNLSLKLLDLQVKRNHEKSEVERKTLEEDIKLYEQMIEDLKKELAKDMQGPQVPFGPIQEVPLMSFIFFSF